MAALFRYYIRFFTLLLLLCIKVLETEQVKVSIKSNVGDWCISAKGSRAVIIEECYWNGNIAARQETKKEQIFDVHPEDIDEHQESQATDSTQPIPFLIRVSKKSSSSSTLVATSCLSSIFSNLTVERCQLKKSRFLISAYSLAKQLSNFCPSQDSQSSNNHNVRYRINSSDQSCLEFMPKNDTGKPNHSLAFAKCTADTLNQPKKTHLWQFCGQNGNCSLSPLDLNWNPLIKVGFLREVNPVACKKEERNTSSSTAPQLMEEISIKTELAEMTGKNSTNSSFVNGNTGTLVNTTTANSSERTLIFVALYTVFPCLLLFFVT